MKIQLEGQTVMLGTGSVAWSEDPAPALVFLHGAGFDHSVWTLPARHFGRLLAPRVRVAAPDFPGHGGSSGPALTRVEDMAEWLDALLEYLGVPEVAVVGHSLGSLVALEFARHWPTKTRQLALLGTSNPMPVGQVLLGAAADSHPAAYRMANSWSHAQRGGLGASANPGFSNFFSDERYLLRNGEGVYHADLGACHEYQPGDLDLAVETLLLVASSDKMTPPKAGLKAVEGFANASIVRLPDCGHAMLNERPNEVLDALRGFLLPSWSSESS